MDIWVLEQSLKDVDEPDYQCHTVEVFSTRERALTWIGYAGERVRWRYSERNPDWQKGSTLEDGVRTHYLVYKTYLDGALLPEDA